MFIGSAVYSQFTLTSSFSLHSTHPAYVQYLSQTRSSYNYVQYDRVTQMGDRKQNGICEFSTDATRKKS